VQRDIATTRRPPPNDARRLSVEHAAPILGISTHTLRQWLRARRIPFFRVGRRVVLDREDLEAFLRAHRVEALPEDSA
jgi:excisionase family DNA binding protein